MTSRYQRFLAPLFLVVLWQVGVSAGLISARAIAAPTGIASSLWELLGSGTLLHHLGISLRRVALGSGIGIGIGVSLALLSGLSRQGETAIDATMQMLRAMPSLALVPLLILWFGIGEMPKITLVALGVTFPIYVTLFGGIRGVDAKLVEAGRLLGLGRAGLIRHVILPCALPSALLGLRYGLGTAWLSLVVAEQINADAGIGYLIMDARDFLRTDIIIVGLIVYSLLGLGADSLVRLIEHHALAWRPTFIRS
jgi:sulfonate transport system permease protein